MVCKGFHFFIAAMILLSWINLYANDNVVINPGFEGGKEGWHDRTCAIEIVTKPVHNGRGSGRAIRRGANWQGIKQSLFGKMVNGKTYKVSGWVRLDNVPVDTVAISFEQQDDNGTQYIGVARGVATDSNWIQLSGEFTPVIRGNLSVLDVYFEGPKPGVNFFVDDVIVYGPEVNPPEIIPADPTGSATIDASIHHQTIEGFGGSGAYYTWNFINNKKKDEVCNLLFKRLGLDIFRIRNNYDIEPNSFKETVEIVKCAKASLDGDLKILISSWSPPAYLKSNNSTIGGTLKQKNGKFMYTEFADWWYNSLVAYRKEGIKADYISVQNELDYEAPWNACQFTPTESLDSTLAAFDVAFETVWQKLNKEMRRDMPKLLFPESSGLGNAEPYLKEIGNLSHIYGYAHHLYDCSGCGSNPDRFIPRMITLNNIVKQYGNKPIFQTEFENEPSTWNDAISTAILIHNSLTVENVSAYLYWDLFWNHESGLISLSEDQSSYTIKSTYYTFKQYSAFIHFGWQRVEASTKNTGVRISAYINPDNQKLTIVIINTTEDVDIFLDLAFKDFSVTSGKIYRSSENENCILVGNYDNKNSLELPANSVTTLTLER